MKYLLINSIFFLTDLLNLLVGELVVTGDVLVPSELTVAPPRSCLRMDIKEEIMCGGGIDCAVPDLATYNINNPVIKDQKIAFKMTIKNAKRNIKLIVGAVLNIGWCKSGDDWIRNGDYHTASQIDFDPPPQGDARIGVVVEKYVTSTDGKCIPLNGYILPADTRRHFSVLTSYQRLCNMQCYLPSRQNR